MGVNWRSCPSHVCMTAITFHLLFLFLVLLFTDNCWVVTSSARLCESGLFNHLLLLSNLLLSSYSLLPVLKWFRLVHVLDKRMTLTPELYCLQLTVIFVDVVCSVYWRPFYHFLWFFNLLSFSEAVVVRDGFGTFCRLGLQKPFLYLQNETK